MVPTETDGQVHQSSLRREWSRAFTVMLALLVLAPTASLVGVRHVVDNARATARQLDMESATVARLRLDLTNHEQSAHRLLSGQPIDRPAFVQQQTVISGEFAAATQVFPTGNGLRGTLETASQSWEAGLKAYGLWGDQALTIRGHHEADNPTFGAASDATRALLDNLSAPSLRAMNDGLTHNASLEGILTASLILLFGFAFAVTVYFRRRMSHYLLKPVASMHEGVLLLQAGDYSHRIPELRHDELGELARAFNGMASTILESHEVLTIRATRDSLTGLANRAALNEYLNAMFTSGIERRARCQSLLFIDVDDFKNVNDSVGHEGGDSLLVQLAARLNACVRPNDLVARLGGDEFAVVVADDDQGGAAAVAVCDRILAELHQPFFVADAVLIVSVSIGVAPCRPDTTDAAELLRQADFAMYTAKGAGKADYQFYGAHPHAQTAAATVLAGSHQ